MERIVQGSGAGVIFISQGRSVGRDVPVAEVRLATRDLAIKFRKTFVEKIKNNEDFGRIHVANSVSLATRIRIDILKGIAQKMKGVDGMDLWVQAYTSRPVLQIKKNDDQRPMSLTFADAIEKYGMRLNDDDLGPAYRRVGRAFDQQLELNFGVLKDGMGMSTSIKIKTRF